MLAPGEVFVSSSKLTTDLATDGGYPGGEWLLQERYRAWSAIVLGVLGHIQYWDWDTSLNGILTPLSPKGFQTSVL